MRLWTYWESSQSYGKPDYIDLCLESMRKYSGGHEVVLVTPDNIGAFIPNLREDVWLLQKPAHRADYFRVILMYLYGGIYMDADTVVLKDLAYYFDLLKVHSYWGYGKSYGKPENGVFGALPKNPLIKVWVDECSKKLDTIKAGENVHWYAFNKSIWHPILKGRKYLHFSNDYFHPINGAADNADRVMLSKSELTEYLKPNTVAVAIFNSLLKNHIAPNRNPFGREALLNGDTFLSKLFQKALKGV